jgi:hypothetical protein
VSVACLGSGDCRALSTDGPWESSPSDEFRDRCVHDQISTKRWEKSLRIFPKSCLGEDVVKNSVKLHAERAPKTPLDSELS